MIDAVKLIEEKRDGLEHPPERLAEFVSACLEGSIPDYQASAWLMAVYFQGLTANELESFTLALANSGKLVEFPPELHCVDKHSTGGVGDKTSLILVPLVASCGVPVAKLSGRGLGFTGGTVDKFESIAGFRSHLSMTEFVDQVARIGCAISGHSTELAPAEKKFYELRDVTGTIPSIPLIASSILSKKIAGGSQAFVFDVKTGSGAFMKTQDDSRALARQLVGLSRSLGRKSLAVISSMEQPLGRWVGNAAEVREAIEVLKGQGPSDTVTLCTSLGGAMLMLSGRASSLENGESLCREALGSGRALDQFRKLLEAQGADPRCIDHPDTQLPLPAECTQIRADLGGKVSSFETYRVGTALRHLGGGRLRKEDPIDHGVAIEVMAKIGDSISVGDPLFNVYHRGGAKAETACKLLKEAYAVSSEAYPPSLVLEVLA